MRLLLLIFFLYSLPSLATPSNSSFSRNLNSIEDQLYSLPIKAQARLIDMEAVELKKKQPPPLLVRYFILRASAALLLNEAEQAINASEKGMIYVEGKPEFKAEQFQLKLRLIQALLMQGKNQLVLSQLNSLLEAAESFNDPATTAEFLLVKGQAYRDNEEYDISMAALMSSLETAKQTDDQVLLKRISSNLGGVLLNLNGFDKAELLLEQSYLFFKKRKMAFNQLLVKMDIAELAKKQGQDEKAIQEYLQALTLAQVLGDGFHRFRINLQIAELLLNRGETERMKQYLRASEGLSEREHTRYFISKLNLLKVNKKLINKNFQGALVLLSTLLPKLNKYRSLNRSELQLHLAASKAYYGLGDFKNAYLTLLNYQESFSQFSADEQLDNLERQKLLYKLERLKAENQQLSWNNVLHTLELENSEDEIEYLNVLIFFAIVSATLASLAALWINRRRIRWGRIANTDSLTNLYNRRYLSHKLLSLNKPDNTTPLSCILLDIDLFKVVNDSYGHIVGDEVLVKVATLFINNVREKDICARIGGEEFMILLPNTNLQQASDIAEDLRLKIESLRFVSLKGEPFTITSSFGVVEASKEQSFSELSNAVDLLLYTAKQNGRNRVETGTPKFTNSQQVEQVHSKMAQQLANLKRKTQRLLFMLTQLIK
ncbi:GGDEF domain-containing protein [Shewanella nanhaiensis]|uniref:diguanylate cyclase n=1 Tax=Shewanella nanhaiensis TaxID=2864872 RepID=A0ABS7E3I4_9GAMM|nr:GGDEF domain-containing protein [Shewanella nanhaiensis]MBW8184144.1 GGDEF domain-containing protein [Shewanella nanhaiensis]